MKRRSFLMGAFAGTAALALGVNLYSPELILSDEVDTQNYRLLFNALLPIILDGALPDVAVRQIAAKNRTLVAIEATIASLPDEQRTELLSFLEMLDSRLGLLLLSSSMTPLLLRKPAELTAMLESWRQSYVTLLYEAYLGLRDLIMASYYGCPEHWYSLRYTEPELLREVN